jgi:hypothetical protein
MDATTCPECGAPAEITRRSALESTDGPVEHVKLQCVRRHWFLMPTFLLAEYLHPQWRTPAAIPSPAYTRAPVTRTSPRSDG